MSVVKRRNRKDGNIRLFSLCIKSIQTQGPSKQDHHISDNNNSSEKVDNVSGDISSITDDNTNFVTKPYCDNGATSVATLSVDNVQDYSKYLTSLNSDSSQRPNNSGTTLSNDNVTSSFSSLTILPSDNTPSQNDRDTSSVTDNGATCKNSLLKLNSFKATHDIPFDNINMQTTHLFQNHSFKAFSNDVHNSLMMMSTDGDGEEMCSQCNHIVRHCSHIDNGSDDKTNYTIVDSDSEDSDRRYVSIKGSQDDITMMHEM